MNFVTYFAALSLGVVACAAETHKPSNEGNRLTVVDDAANLYYPDHLYPRLTTPQWAGEDVDFALVLAIDDMRDSGNYETYLRPILERLKKIDGRAPASVMANWCDPSDPQIKKWLEEGVTVETHTADHPCPILAKGDFAAAKSTYDRCVDHMFTIPNHKPVGFRTPCMDSINSASPRLFAEILMKTTDKGNFLANSSSVGVLLNSKDPELPKDLALDEKGNARFSKYVLKGFVNYIENYPYPYLVGNKMWELPFCMPDDYEGFAVLGEKSLQTVADMKAAIDAVAVKKGLWVMTFHPYAWLANTQVVELVDHVDGKYGKKGKFFNLREVQERMDKHLLGGHPVRAKNGDDNGVRLLDLNDDGYLDVVIGNDQAQQTRVWDQAAKKWLTTPFPGKIVTTRNGKTELAGARFGVMGGTGYAVLLQANEDSRSAWRFNGEKWTEAPELMNGLEAGGQKLLAAKGGLDTGLRFRDMDGDKVCELLVSNPRQNIVLAWNENEKSWKPMKFQMPAGISIATEKGGDAGLRFVDFNKDGYDDIVFSNQEKFGLWLYVPELFLGFQQGWSREVIHGRRGEKPEIPMIVRGGDQPENGSWFARDYMWVQNEDTATLPDLVDRVAYSDLLNGFQPPPLKPEASLKSIETSGDYVVELVAHEPAVQDPVAIDWSADGKMWVVEMRDYPTDNNGAVGGVVKILSDEDKDGIYEKATVFLDKLSTPNGIMPWRSGVLISATPDVIYAEDTDGDGKADRQEIILTGFGKGNQQHRANGFEFGLDNWVHGANGDSGGAILSPKTGKRFEIGGRDFRFNPDTGAFATTSGQTQFGRRRDDWGNWFGGANHSWGWHYYLPEHYLQRNSRLAVPGTFKHMAQYPDSGRVFPIARLQQRFNDVGLRGHVTSACSFMPYRDNLFGPEFSQSIFISEPSHNLIHREVLEQDGVSFISSRSKSEQTREFLASKDPWFRPTGLKTGPDGAIYVADMYRLVIEHPEWIPEDVRQRINVRAGEDMGRIYRVRPRNVSLRDIPRLDKKSGPELAAAMESPNGWQRDTAHRLLLERQDKTAAKPLAAMARSSSNLHARVQALCALDGIGSVTIPLLTDLLNDKESIIREHAIRISETFLRQGTELPDRFKETLLAKISDPMLRVRFQLAFTLGEWNSPEAAQALAGLAAKDGNAESIQIAALSSSSKFPELVMAQTMLQNREDQSVSMFVENLVQLLALDNKPAALQDLLDQLASSSKTQPLPLWKLGALAALLEAQEKLDATAFSFSTERWTPVWKQSREILGRQEGSDREKAAALRLLGREPGQLEGDLRLMTGLLAPHNSLDLQQAALHEMGRVRGIDLAGVLLEKWPTATPQTRALMMNLLMRREQGASSILKALVEGRLAMGDLGPGIRQQLISHPSQEIREKAEKILAISAGENNERERLIRSLADQVGKLKGNADTGQTLFENNCAACHKAGQIGFGAGPNLAMLYDQTLEQLLAAIIDPNRSVEDKYRNYIAELKNGEQISGILLSETGGSITMMGISGQQQTLLRQDLARLTAENRSMMPEGFEQFLQPQDYADLVSFIRSSALAPKPFTGNKPELRTAGTNGELRLPASSAEVYGDTLVFETQYQNLGFWSSENDRAVWNIEVEAGKEFEVWMDWACPENTAGNSFVFQVGENKVAGQISSTGNWNQYQQRSIGRIKIPAGKHRAVFKSKGTLNGHLLDLREVRLTPHPPR